LQGIDIIIILFTIHYHHHYNYDLNHGWIHSSNDSHSVCCDDNDNDDDAGKKIEHLGIRIELIGQIEVLLDKANVKFVSMIKELESAGKVIAVVTCK